MKQLIISIAVLLFFSSAWAQESQKSQDNQEPVFQIVENPAQYQGGQAALAKFLQTNMKYPEEDRKNGKEGKVYLQFIVEKDGSVSEVTPVGKVKELATKAMIDEAMRLLNEMPKFEPATQKGITVRSRFILPIIFKLQ